MGVVKGHGVVKLYGLKPNTKFKIVKRQTPYEIEFVKGSDGDDAILVFHRVDGMYAQCFYHNSLELITAYSDVVIVD